MPCNEVCMQSQEEGMQPPRQPMRCYVMQPVCGWACNRGRKPSSPFRWPHSFDVRNYKLGLQLGFGLKSLRGVYTCRCHQGDEHQMRNHKQLFMDMLATPPKPLQRQVPLSPTCRTLFRLDWPSGRETTSTFRFYNESSTSVASKFLSHWRPELY